MNNRDKLVDLLLFANETASISGRELDTDEVNDFADFLDINDVVVQRWISVEDRPPKHGAIVLCYTKYFYEVLQWDDDAEQWVGQYSVNAKHYVTHWMPLPELPKEE